jgi:hypothetical protein
MCILEAPVHGDDARYLDARRGKRHGIPEALSLDGQGGSETGVDRRGRVDDRARSFGDLPPMEAGHSLVTPPKGEQVRRTVQQSTNCVS